MDKSVIIDNQFWKVSSIKIIIRLIIFLKPYLGQVLLSVLLGVAAIMSVIGLMGTSSYLIAYAALKPSIAALQVAVVGLRFFGICRAIFRYLERLSSHSINLRLLAHFRVWFYQKIEPLAPAILMQYRSGDLLNRVVEDIETLESFYNRIIAPPLIWLVVTLGIGFWAGIFEPIIGWIIVTGLFVVGLVIPIFVYILSRSPGKNLVDKQTQLSILLVDFIQGMGDLVVFGNAKKWVKHILRVGNDFGKAQRKMVYINGISSGLISLVSNLTLLCVLFVAIPLVNNKHLNGIMLAVLALVTITSFEAAIPLSTASQYLKKNILAAEQLFSLVDTSPVIFDDRNNEKEIEGSKLSIRHLSFQYEPTLPYVLRDVSIDLNPGKWIAIIGPNGAGKSTLIHLILRFWNYQEGNIVLGNREIKQYRSEDIRGIMSVISESTYLFSGTVKRNLLLAKEDATDEDLQIAVKKVGLNDWLVKTSQGIDTWIGEHGEHMSGGERQRLAIARALLRNSPILLLDEPTTHLDAISERQILQTIFQVAKGRSLLLVTHRMTDLEQMDEIVVLKGGVVIERGSHNVLLTKNGMYARMWKIQNLNIL